MCTTWPSFCHRLFFRCLFIYYGFHFFVLFLSSFVCSFRIDWIEREKEIQTFLLNIICYDCWYQFIRQNAIVPGGQNHLCIFVYIICFMTTTTIAPFRISVLRCSFNLNLFWLSLQMAQCTCINDNQCGHLRQFVNPFGRTNRSKVVLPEHSVCID